VTFNRTAKILLAFVLTGSLIGGTVLVLRSLNGTSRTQVVAYFDNSNGIYVGDDVMILGVRVGKIDKIEPQPQDAKITFSFDREYNVPADANAVIMSPALVSARAIQLTPAYTEGPTMRDGAVIPRTRTAVPVEFDDLRKQLEKLTETLQPTEPGGVSTLGAFINTAADNLRGQGANIRETLIQVSQTFSALGDHSDDIYGTIKNLATLVSALQSSTDLMRELNTSLISVTGLLANDPNEIANAVKDLNDVVGEAQQFIADNRESLGTTSDKLSSVSQALVESIDDIKQTLHITPTAFSNFLNIYEPANASLTGSLAVNNFADPITFICGAIQAASRLGNEQAAKLCVQYLAPIVKNRQYNFPPLGGDPVVGAQARPNEVTFSEDWLRPLTEAGRVRDYYEGPLTPPTGVPPPADAPLAAEAPAPPVDAAPADQSKFPVAAASTDPASGLPGMMVPPGGGS
jgi:phospholipid/cholesterol/gamma-HCH transport system substrate-binding protein